MPRPDPDPTADWYRRAARDLAPHSALHAGWAAAWAEDPALLGLVDELPREHRQPSLVFSALAAVGLDVHAAWPALRAEVVERWSAIAPVAAGARTQTNEVGRCAPLLVVLQRIPGPIALLELGAAAGLCLALERWSYRFFRDDVAVGEGGAEVRLGAGLPELACAVSGDGPLPAQLPEIVWRRGIDLAPLSAADPGDRAWLEALVPPDREDRRVRLRQALAAVRDEPPIVVAGDALAALPAVAAEAPADATLVVVSLGTAVYLPPADRARLLAVVVSLGARCVTLEAASALPEVARSAGGRAAPHPSPFLLALDGEAIAAVAPHGDRVSFLGPAEART